jgi:hypothetical protein
VNVSLPGLPPALSTAVNQMTLPARTEVPLKLPAISFLPLVFTSSVPERLVTCEGRTALLPALSSIVAELRLSAVTARSAAFWPDWAV